MTKTRVKAQHADTGTIYYCVAIDKSDTKMWWVCPVNSPGKLERVYYKKLRLAKD